VTERSQLLEWTAAVLTELDLDVGLSVDVDIKLVLDLARDAAHAVERPAAPLTTYLLGFAAGRCSGGMDLDPTDVQALAARLTGLAARWPTTRG